MENSIGEKQRIIAFYLPQYHPIPENDQFWGKGFTEWTNVTKAKPLFKGHHQPNLPAELGFYDLRVPETREAQADLAREHGIEGFCYWHYWMGNGKMLLERPLREVIDSGKPDFPFCIAWANHDWTGVWCGEDSRMLVKQQYPGKSDYEKHFYYLLDAFKDQRYICVNGSPVFMVFRAFQIPDNRLFLDTFRELALKEGLKGLHIIGGGISPDQAREWGYDACTYYYNRIVEQKFPENPILRKGYQRILSFLGLPKVYKYKRAMKYFLKQGPADLIEYPAIIPNWDTTPRLGKKAVVLTRSTPELFYTHVKEALSNVRHKPAEQRILFLKSWNEWAEGNYIEPDLRHGRSYLQSLKKALNEEN